MSKGATRVLKESTEIYAVKTALGYKNLTFGNLGWPTQVFFPLLIEEGEKELHSPNNLCLE